MSGDDELADLRALAGPAFQPGQSIVAAARALCAAIHEQFDYDHSFTEVSTPLATVLTARRGVCQDFAHLAISALRMFGLPARYVSGYIESSPSATAEAHEPMRASERQRASDQERPAWPGNAMNASHAWCAVWVPGVGWVDFDPTNGHLPADSHVTVAWGRDYGDVAPVRGVVVGPPASQQLTVAVDVTRL